VSSSQYGLPLPDGCDVTYRNEGPLRRLFAAQHKTYKQLVHDGLRFLAWLIEGWPDSLGASVGRDMLERDLSRF
jgi:hypothetical protein